MIASVQRKGGLKCTLMGGVVCGNLTQKYSFIIIAYLLLHDRDFTVYYQTGDKL